MTIHTMQLLTAMMGDITLAWTEDQAEMMIAVIQKKMDEGYTFFIKEDDGRELRIKKIADLNGRNAITIGDKDAEELIRQGKIGIVDVSGMLSEDDETSEISDKPMRRAKTAREAATSKTVATSRKVGG